MELVFVWSLLFFKGIRFIVGWTYLIGNIFFFDLVD